MNDTVRILVSGATGMQGGAVARAAHAAGLEVTALVRDPVKATLPAGVRLVQGDTEDPAALERACAGQTTVFSMQPTGRDGAEVRQATNLARAAAAAGVRHLVHSSVSGTGWRVRHPDVDPGTTGYYWDQKEEAEAAVRSAGPTYTIVKPAFFLENLLPPKVGWMFPLLGAGELLTATAPTTPVGFVAAEDFGAAVVAVAREPERFAGAEIELGGDAPTFPELAGVLTEATGRQVRATTLPAVEVDARLGRFSWSATQEWFDAVGYPARPAHAAEVGLSMSTTAKAWAERHREALRAVIGRS
ncbi:NmrA family NAD(P)-binding protein [Pseudonocardia sp. NPDC049154]|uniref:NmrA family NAD(P)-binding protein n=1 Tax=Pseudonocardia sp. NPDC049154 TaxID=3155501 RepID=UPI0033F92763